MDDYRKPLPVVTELNRPFWDGARREVLQVQCCTECGHLRYPIAEVCPRCLSGGVEWVPLSGVGEVFACVTYHRAYAPEFSDDVPYTVAIVQLDEGPRMLSNVVGPGRLDARVGDRVRVVFDAVTAQTTVPRFRLAQD
ncbi:hypothetical protein GCU56_17145 [Geodermatophilus sabuli]|uniref:Zn-ribbon domain-containing OB-fold protein n=1 Tax=Geodermatophilus sabuli TaxID=1564158 RepID=A0A7K3W3W6_9ACTN|nr:OB-fold domain-containing protein [Geodermatophilus sabuli]NEK59586.1 hypothetical protein [Geodermatophilus sabuli]